MIHQQEVSSVLTSWGAIRVECDLTGIIRCNLPLLSSIPSDPFAILEAGTDPYATYIRELFDGKRPQPPAVGELQGTDFQHRVWKALLQIPAGQTCSYRALAERLHCVKAVRAIANACGRNPVPLFIPCHRVIRSDGNLGGFSSGTAWKQLLLAVEQ